MHGGNLKLV